MAGMFAAKNGGSTYKQVSLTDFSDDDDDEDFIQRQVRNQRLQMQQQDEGLEMLSKSASRLGQLSMGIAEELSMQNK